MPVFKFLALTNPAEGREDEFNDWYTNQHVKDVVNLPHGISGQRFRIEGDPQWQYAAIYELEGETAEEAVAKLREQVGTPALMMSDSLDAGSMKAFTLTPISDLYTG